MNRKQYLAVPAILISAACLVFSANAARLGDSAGALTIKEWVKGKPVQISAGTNVYVVEFWATWCGPCKTSIPALTEMQAKFKSKGVIFVGISDETPDIVKPFVAEMGDKMNYAVACDDERKTAAGYMDAYGQQGIPTAFIVKGGKVLWLGHPMSELESTLEKVINGTYDVKTAQKRESQRAAWTEYVRASMAGDPRAAEMGKKYLEDVPNEVDPLVEFAFGIAANQQNKHRDFSLAMVALDRAEKLSTGKNALIIGIRGVTTFESGQREKGLALAREAVSICKEPQRLPMLQNFVRVMEYTIQNKPQTGTSPPAPTTVAPRTSAPPAK